MAKSKNEAGFNQPVFGVLRPGRRWCTVLLGLHGSFWCWGSRAASTLSGACTPQTPPAAPLRPRPLHCCRRRVWNNRMETWQRMKQYLELKNVYVKRAAGGTGSRINPLPRASQHPSGFSASSGEMLTYTVGVPKSTARNDVPFSLSLWYWVYYKIYILK